MENKDFGRKLDKKLLIKNARIVSSEMETEGDILIENGIIKEIGEDLTVSGAAVIDAAGLAVMPGLFDMHVHFREPGFEHKETVKTGCRAAVWGGVTGVACMPNTKPVIDSPETVRHIISEAEGTGCRVYPYASATKGMKGEELGDYEALKAAGAIAVSDDGVPIVKADMMRKAQIKARDNKMLIASHCEDLDIIDGGIMNKGRISESLGVRGMDRLSENLITIREMLIAKDADTDIHICHVSTKECIKAIKAAKLEGVRVTCETAPHYFMLTEEKLLARDADFRMNPPLRTKADVEAVIEGVLDGTVDAIVTDHAPHAAEEKADFEKAPNGVVGLETSLAATLTALYHTGKISLCKIVYLMSENPRRLLGLEPPEIAVGKKAELIIVDTEKEWLVEPEKLHSKSKNTVFKGMTLKGKVMMTINDGKIYDLKD